MPVKEAVADLESIAGKPDVLALARELTLRWRNEKIGAEIIEPVLRVLESHPTKDFGIPGPLVQFVERFLGKGYEEELIDSLKRRPTRNTVLMLSRLIFCVRGSNRKKYINIMMESREHPLADAAALDKCTHSLRIHTTDGIV
jgi:hypothetical protein